jgi:3-aminobutyryl-CoA ammonia-lyase
MSDGETAIQCAALRVFMSQDDAHYSGGLVAGARILGLFGDAATALLLERDGLEGLLASYQDVQFIRPVLAGDTVDVEAWLMSAGRTSRRIHFRASVRDQPVCTAEGVAIAKPLQASAAPTGGADAVTDDGAIRA